MTIIVFLIDTSASMFQRTHIGGRTTLLDVAKSAVETFVRIRQRILDGRNDRYMLLTFEESPNNIKAGWKENFTTFMNELKNLQCYTLTTMGVAVKQAFDLLNINRMTTGIDTYGQGRCPFFLEAAVIVLITDGGRLTNANGVQEEFNLPMHSPIPGSEMTREPFRWDQRLFALVLRLSGSPAIERDSMGLVPSDGSPIDAMCEVTGGRSYSITSHRMLNQCIDSLVQKVQNGVVLNFEKIGPDPPPPSLSNDDCFIDRDGLSISGKEGNNIADGGPDSANPAQSQNCPPPAILPNSTSWHNCRRMIYVPKASKAYCVGHWPIPESFWPEITASMLPPRSAHPSIKFTCTNSEPLVIENLPFDKYELEPSPLTQYILSRKQPKTCWQVFVANSYKNSEVGHPFGYLKASTNLSCVNLFIMPYNYPVLLPLLDELSKVHRWMPTNEWRTQFQNYMRTLPLYYSAPLRRALTRLGTPIPLAQTLVPDNAESMSYSVSNYLKRLKNQAKTEYDKLCNEVTMRQNAALKSAAAVASGAEQIRVSSRVSLKKDLFNHPVWGEKLNSISSHLFDALSLSTPLIPGIGSTSCVGSRTGSEVCGSGVGGSVGGAFVLAIDKSQSHLDFRNPFDVSRDRTIEYVSRMRRNLLHSQWQYVDADSAHALPIAQMGNYLEHLKRQQPQLREIESTPMRQHMFGNPFKIDKRMMVDEADIDLQSAQQNMNMSAMSSSSQPLAVNNAVCGGGNFPGKLFNKKTDARSLYKRKPGPLAPTFTFRRFCQNMLNKKYTDDSSSENGGSVCSESAPSSPESVVCSMDFGTETNTTTSTSALSPLNANASVTTITSPTCLTVPITNGVISSSDLHENRFRYNRSPSPPLANEHNWSSNNFDIRTIHGNHSSSQSNQPPSTNLNTVEKSKHSPMPTKNSTTMSDKCLRERWLGTNDSSYGGWNNFKAVSTADEPFGSFSVKLNNHTGDIIRNATNTESSKYSKIQLSSPFSTKVELTSEEREKIDLENFEIRKQLNRLVRRPGKNYTPLFDCLRTLKGSAEVQAETVRLIVEECRRFKRQILVNMLDEYIDTLVGRKLNSTNNNNHQAIVN